MNTLLAKLALGLATFAGVPAAQLPPARATQAPAAAATDSTVDAVTVQNDRTVPVTVYLDYGPFDRRLGVVAPYETATLALPAWAVRGRETVSLVAHPEGAAEDLATQSFTLRPPARLGMLVPPDAPLAAPASSAPERAMWAAIPPEELADATLTVDNPRDVAATVYVEDGQFDLRLGRVPARGRVTLRFPLSAVAPDQSIEIFVHPDGGTDLASQTLHLHRGEHLGLRVPAR